MYYVNGESGSSLLIESTDSMILGATVLSNNYIINIFQRNAPANLSGLAKAHPNYEGRDKH